MAEWIDVDDRLPDNDRYVWVTTDYGFVGIDWYDPYEPEWNTFNGEIIAWMEIGEKPEPYNPSTERI